jgi:hypothetical protein
MIAANQYVFSEFPELKTAVQLAAVGEFVVLCYDATLRRICARKARAYIAVGSTMVRIRTEKGVFIMSARQLIRLSTGEYILAGSLRPGMSLHAAAVSSHPQGYRSVHLQDGHEGRELLHRMVADVHGWDIRTLVVHHRDEDKVNNRADNLVVITQAEHAALHGKKLAATGQHVFQTRRFSKSGNKNGMHSSGPFWKHAEKSTSYRQKQGEILKSSGRASAMQLEAARQKRCNGAFKILNAGYPTDTFELYYIGFKAVFGRAGHSKAHIRKAIDDASRWSMAPSRPRYPATSMPSG